MRTVHVTDALSAYLDGELTEGERAQVERHLKTCEDCRRQLTGLRDVVTLVRSSEPIAAPEGFRAQVRARVEQLNAPPSSTRQRVVIPLAWRVIGAAAAVGIIGIVAVSLLRTAGPVAMRETAVPSEDRSAPPEGVKSAADQRSSDAPAAQRSSDAPTVRGNTEAPAPEIAQRTIPKQRPSVVRSIILIALPVLTAGTLAWIALRRRRLRRAWRG